MKQNTVILSIGLQMPSKKVLDLLKNTPKYLLSFGIWSPREEHLLQHSTFEF